MAPPRLSIESVSGDANPALANGEIICTAAVLPSTACSLVLTVRVPLAETRTVALGGEALVIADGKTDIESYSMKAVSVELVAREFSSVTFGVVSEMAVMSDAPDCSSASPE